jgi:hypothetical protein
MQLILDSDSATFNLGMFDQFPVNRSKNADNWFFLCNSSGNVVRVVQQLMNNRATAKVVASSHLG